ncbi:vomeromodulin-like [Psammomys obesus]|uniref:vomeromodulin-like n=1 Tax=Psammomys obesus TaxID=48139 RepID=UPI00245352F0|nr:vomeromodulin-like [Psammomys obesus]
MWALRALAIMLSIQAGTLDPVGISLTDNNLAAPVPPVNPRPLILPSIKDSSSHQGLPSQKHSAASKTGKCSPAARYFYSSGKLQDYLMGTLPQQIEDMVKCEEVKMGGLIGDVLSLAEDTELLSLLNIENLLQAAGGLGLGKEGDDSAKPSSDSKGSGGLSKVLSGGLPILGSSLNLGDKSSEKGLLKKHLSNITNSLDGVVDDVSNVKDSIQEKVNEVVPDKIKDSLEGVLKTKNKDLGLSFMVESVKEDETNIKMAADEIQVHSEVTATIGGKGLLGPVISLLQLQSKMTVMIKIGISSNNTKCVTLDVQDTHIQVNTLSIQLVETLEESVPLPVPLDLNDILPMLLTIKINENLEESTSCGIDLSGFNDCKNTTGLFSYTIRTPRISPEGLTILYCVKGNFSQKAEPVIGTPLCPNPKNASIALTISSSMVTMLLKFVAENSSVQMNDLKAKFDHVKYKFLENKTLTITYDFTIKRDGRNFANGKTKLIISHNSKISGYKVSPDLKLISFQNSVKPEEYRNEVEDTLSQLVNKTWSGIIDYYKKMNLPVGVSSLPLKNATVNSLKSNDLQAAN